MLHIGEPKLVYVINTFSSMAATLNEACGTDPAWLCRKVFEWTDNSDIAGVATWLVDRPVKVAVIALLALIIRRVVHRAIDGLIDRLMAEAAAEETEKAYCDEQMAKTE